MVLDGTEPASGLAGEPGTLIDDESGDDLSLVSSADVSLLALVDGVSFVLDDEGGHSGEDPEGGFPRFGHGEGEVVGVACVACSETPTDAAEACIHAAVDEIGQAWTGGGTLGERAFVRGEVDEDLGGFLVPAESSEEFGDAFGAGLAEEIDDVHVEDGGTVGVHGGVGEDGAAFFEAVGGGVGLEAPQEAFEDLLLEGFQLGIGGADSSGSA